MKFHELAIGSALMAAAVAWHTNVRADTLDGKALFVKNCAACHQPTGKGIPGAFPALAGNSFVQGPARDPASVLLKGRGGMPNFSGSLDDAEIAQVLSYVRSSWGNSAAPLTQDEVSALRTDLQVPPASHSRFGNKH
ncbi:cytochrome c [Massilia agilis]|uniref:Cytochrome c n=1 Tax=Massilia agilis TaxID=1811226 RepID=A0ABT2D6M0_9BURK|nr:cytochrome c [Massilia agilis]MCS0806952.1 cytochrome c [Massilia agilis]